MAITRHQLTKEVYYSSHTSLKSIPALADEGKDLQDPSMLFGKYIPEKCLIHFPSPRGVGKSWFCMQLCIAIAGEWTEFLGEEINLHGNTLYINNELSETVIRRRAKKLTDHLPKETSHNFKAMVYTLRNNLATDMPVLVQILNKLKPVLVIIDNLRLAFMGTDTNNNKEITQLMFMLLAFCESSRASVVITDHFRKHTSSLLSESDLQTGSGIKTDLSDGDFFLRKSAQDKNLRLLKRGKSRHFEEEDFAKLIRLNGQSLWFELVEEQVNEAEHICIKTLQDKEEQKDIARSLKGQGHSLEDIARILGKGKTTIHRWLHKEELPEDKKNNSYQKSSDNIENKDPPE
ncbi:MAG: hypothetical protein EPN37_09600 [Chitinophagaceae bacterium]|nr:MAG: hypothetical protein EPN37_09600 [Chitinophagaceae bacterium]